MNRLASAGPGGANRLAQACRACAATAIIALALCAYQFGGRASIHHLSTRAAAKLPAEQLLPAKYQSRPQTRITRDQQVPQNWGVGGRTLAAYQAQSPGEPAGSDQPVPVTLSYIAVGSPKTITVAGSFNNWSKQASPLTQQRDRIHWSATLQLAPGIYTYKFVINDTRWLTPPDAPRVNDGSGNINGVLTVAPPDYEKLPAKRGDGLITASGVIHHVSGDTPASPVRSVRYIERVDRGQLFLTLRTRRDDVQSCQLLLAEGVAPRRQPMAQYAADTLFDYWGVHIEVPAGARQLKYAFLLRDGDQDRLYDSGQMLWDPGHTERWFQLYLDDFPPFETPDWARDAIFYQIFPDRFANGDKSNDPPDVQPWGATPTYSNWMGGDLAGVLMHFEYLRDLGVNALYFNPIFSARSSHGYDTTDYKRVDPRFGTLATLKSVTARAHLHGWHVILDGVFNHTGVDFEPFKSVQNEGPDSKYRSWYFLHGYPARANNGKPNYEGWNGSPWMPKLNVNNPATRDYLLDVSTYWLREASTDGWRLDAANEVSHDFWKAFRKRVKSAKPDAYLLGEIWTDSRDWLRGDQMDAVTNYRWRGAVLDFFAIDKSKPTQFDAALAQIRSDYPPAATAVMFNMLGSHDVERIRTVCRSDWPKERQAIAFQMCYPGAPVIYYGDEVGMEGGKDPDNRRAMPWDQSQWDKPTHAFYKSAIAMRKQHAVLRRGEFQTLVTDDKAGVYAFLRSYQDERAIVVFNRSDQEQKAIIPIARVGQKPYTIWLDGGSAITKQGDNLVVSLPKRGFAVLGR